MKKYIFLSTFFVALSLFAYDFSPYKKIVCFGDSITHGGYYHMYLQEYLAESDPSHPREVVNKGISGDTVPKLLKRADRMLKQEKPDLVLIMIGTNDLQFTTRFAEKDLPFDAAYRKYPVFKRFEKELGELVDIFNKAKVKVVILATPPYNESANPEIKAKVRPNMNTSGVRNLLVIEKRLAGAKGAEFIDIYTPVLKNLLECDAEFPRGKTDRVHPSKKEHLIIARAVIGKAYTPGAKEKKAMQCWDIQRQIQGIEAYCSRIPDSCKTVEEQIRFYKNWVAQLKGNDFKYWNKMLPVIIATLKDPDAKLTPLYQKRDTAFKKLYQK